MQYYRCKCGKHESWTSMGVSVCAGCLECGTDLAQSPSAHEPIKPHDFKPYPVETNDGTQYLDRCIHCTHTRAQVAKIENNERAGLEIGAGTAVNEAGR